jgi:tetratricopeptide (TPR) repeat protein
MLESLLKTGSIPSDLKQFVQNKAEGNPFYLEELINSLIESETLIRDNSSWKITRPISESDISSSIHGLISGRLDRLEKETKRILQEASVIGRAFLYEILKRITELEDRIDRGLSTLERLDLIRTRSIQPDLEYMFKHPLTQEVVYNGLLKKERQEIHEQIALVMEGVFQDRLSEFYETLASHFKMGRSIHKAIDYLMKSGEKSIKRYAVEESHQYYKEAYEILVNKSGMPHKEELLIDLLAKWALVFYYRGDFKGLTDLLLAHENLAATIDDKAKAGMYYAWLGFVTFFRGKLKESYQSLCKAVELGEEANDNRVIGYACTWLPWTCAVLGQMKEAIVYGERAQKISKLLPADHYLYFKSLAALGFTHHMRGYKEKVFEAGKNLLDYSQKHSNIRCAVMSNWMMVLGNHVDGDFKSAVELHKEISNIAEDPFYSKVETLYLGISYFLSGQMQEAIGPLKQFITYSKSMGCELLGTIAYMFLGVISMAKGHMSQGLEILKEVNQTFLNIESQSLYAESEYVLGKVYLQVVVGAGPKSLFTMARNIGFIIKNVPFAEKKSEYHFTKAIELAKEIETKGTLAQAYLDLGLLHRAKKRNDTAQECISEAIKIFEECKADGFLKQAKDSLVSL